MRLKPEPSSDVAQVCSFTLTLSLSFGCLLGPPKHLSAVLNICVPNPRTMTMSVIKKTARAVEKMLTSLFPELK